VTGEGPCRRALEDANGRLRLLSAHMRGIIFELDSRARFVRVWTSDPRLLARPESELLGRTVLEALGPELGRRHHEAALATVESGKPARYEYELDVPSGHRHFACESVAVSGVAPGDRHAIFWIRDITDQIHLQRRLVHSERLAAVGALAAGVAHEINNPLAYMMLNAEQLFTHLGRLCPRSESDQCWRPLQECARMIHEGAQRVQRIVADLLQLAQPIAQAQPVDLRQVLVLSLELTRTLWESRARVRSEWEDAPRVLGHPAGLVQVFTHLLANSAEAIEVGAPHDNEIAVVVRRAGRSAVQVEFRDTGVGIPQEDAKRVFEPFFTTKEDGTGLGLAICQTIISSFNGEIRWVDKKTRGSVFRVLLPTADEVEAPDRTGETSHDRAG
jgi:two-component system NtrC family sensor kinase